MTLQTQQMVQDVAVIVCLSPHISNIWDDETLPARTNPGNDLGARYNYLMEMGFLVLGQLE